MFVTILPVLTIEAAYTPTRLTPVVDAAKHIAEKWIIER